MKAAYFALILVLTGVAAAQTTQPPANPNPAQADEAKKRQCKLEGQLLNLVTSEPVRKANLTLRPDAGGTTLKAASDAEGKFVIENIEPGRYSLTAERQGFVTQRYGA